MFKKTHHVQSRQRARRLATPRLLHLRLVSQNPKPLRCNSGFLRLTTAYGHLHLFFEWEGATSHERFAFSPATKRALFSSVFLTDKLARDYGMSGAVNVSSRLHDCTIDLNMFR